MSWKLYSIRNKRVKGKQTKVHLDTFNEPADCFGDALYDLMEENGWIDSINDYEVDGDSEYIAVMAKDPETKSDFVLEFEKETD